MDVCYCSDGFKNAPSNSFCVPEDTPAHLSAPEAPPADLSLFDKLGLTGETTACVDAATRICGDCADLQCWRLCAIAHEAQLVQAGCSAGEPSTSVGSHPTPTHVVYSSKTHVVDSTPTHVVDSTPTHVVDSTPTHVVDSTPEHLATTGCISDEECQSTGDSGAYCRADGQCHCDSVFCEYRTSARRRVDCV